MKNNSKGIVIFAHNNERIDYIKFAFLNAKMIRRNLNVPTSLITDQESLDSIDYNIEDTFDKIILVNKEDFYKKNIRRYRDTSLNSFRLQFHNINRYMVYKLSPYNETILLDSDYFVMSNSLVQCWNSKHDIMINSESIEINVSRKTLPRYISDFSIKMYWATVVYFKKSTEAEQLFSFIEHISKNYKFYEEAYLLPKGTFRNDFSFSIAIHMLNGFKETDNFVKELPIPFLFKSYDNDDIYKVNGSNDITFYVDQLEKGGNYILTRIKDTDIHIMNKYSINRHMEDFLSYA